MKVGDIVRQNNNLFGVKDKYGLEVPAPKTLGTVVAIYHLEDPDLENLKDWQKKWFDKLGVSVDVLWSTGKVSENMASNALDIVCEQNEDS